VEHHCGTLSGVAGLSNAHGVQRAFLESDDLLAGQLTVSSPTFAVICAFTSGFRLEKSHIGDRLAQRGRQPDVAGIRAQVASNELEEDAHAVVELAT